MPNKTSAKKQTIKQYKDVPCPFCSLLCDDLHISKENEQLNVVSNGCKKAKKQFAVKGTKTLPRIAGKKVELDTAIAKAASLLKKSQRPLISGLGTDVTGMRAVMELAEKSGAYLDHMLSDGLVRNMHVLQDRGWILTTFAEVKNRADLIIFAGTDTGNYERFIERLIWNDSTLTDMKPSKREIVYIGDQLNTRAGKSPEGKRPTVIKCAQNNIAEVFANLRTLLSEQAFDINNATACKPKQLIQLAELIKQSNYGVIVWAPGELNFPHAELTIQIINDLIKDLNAESRFAGLSLGGNDGGISAANVCAWQAGYPLRTSFKNGYPEYDPENYSTEKLLQSNNVDCLMWISSFSSDISPAKTSLPSIVIADDNSALDYEPDVFIPVGTVGIDHSGQMIRTDNVVSITLAQLRNIGLSSVKDVVSQITEKF